MKVLEALRKNIIIVLLFFISAVAIIGSGLYYLWALNNFSYFILLFLSLISTSLFFYFIIYTPYRQGRVGKLSSPFRIKFFNLALFLLSLLLLGLIINLLLKESSPLAIASPWHLIPSFFFFFLALFLALTFISFYYKSFFSKSLVIIVYFLFFLISVFIYQFAFGYDQLLHQRALWEILQFGFINPKTFYYIGQYSLEFFLVKTFFIAPDTVSRILVPVMSALFIPLSFFKVFRQKLNSNYYYALLLLLFLPFSIFTYTVPQNLAFLFFILLIIFSLDREFVSRPRNYVFLLALALASFFVHPLAGVPAVIFVIIMFFSFCFFGELSERCAITRFFAWMRKGAGLRARRTKILLISGLYLAQIVILPILLFFVGGKLAWPQIDFSFLSPRVLGQENIFLNFVYFLFFNRFYLFLGLFVLGVCWGYQQDKNKRFKIYFYNFLSLFFSYILSLFVSFPFLSDIDKNSYSQRVFIISLLFLLPIFFNLFLEFVARIRSREKLFKIFSFLFLIFFLLAALYLNYPRQDNHFNSRAYSVSASDFMAVELIAEIDESDNYIVLANQQVGAAAIKKFGFKRYYDGWFYYSVQTGGLLYDYYLKMLDNPNRELIAELLLQVGADNAYVVVNDYWWAYERIVNEMKVEADNCYQTADGRVSIFHFTFTQ